ncbi:PCP degradation transcriptional activation protein [Defluviimonas aquaemixtae]|uniref:PCP degradation transcriptional activation protein n=1 Tax=Albidovulum aquaemixtae TaxID=1542388 RepID=A0A2R8BKX4_9RHOB|nr:LysR family transcriptional regulator [Defluviimonas aquaemixtae]SPH24029.1 PCP degradation transcriptional activation protein [Defluviimonas aquaemixtae]
MNEIDLHRVDLNLLVVFEVLMETRSVTATAEKIGRTQSAVSHSLARLRQQLRDPLLVRVGGKMVPSPFAETLIEDVRPILRGIRRVIAPRSLFDPATSDRVFRIAMPTLTKVIAEVSARVEAEAPNVKVEWLPAHHDVYAALSEGLIDLAHLGGEPRLPDGLEEQIMEPFSWVTFARRGHPACDAWGIDAWRRYPHLMVNVTRSSQSPFPVSIQADVGARRVSAMIGDSAGVASLLANSDFLATFPAILLAWELEPHGLRAMRPPVDLGPVLVRFFWSSRLANDAGGIWIRSIVIEAYRRLQAEAEAMLNVDNLLQTTTD